MKYQNIHQDLIDGCMNGDKKSQFGIYKLYYKAMFNTCLRITKDKIIAEDIMQESFLSAFKNIETYKGEVSFGAWLKKIVINKSLDNLKKKKIELVELDESVADEYEEKADETELNSDKVKIERIKNTINELPEGYRLVLSLYLIEGYDHDEIGQILNISSSTSRSQFTRARQKLIHELNEKMEKTYEKN